MKTWFQKFNVSNALNERRPLPVTAPVKDRPADPASQFAAQCQTLAEALKSPPPTIAHPASLHADIMRAVRASARLTPQPSRTWVPGWQLAGGFAGVLFLALLLVRSTVSPKTAVPSVEAPPSLALAGSILDLGSRLVSTAPAAVLSPLTAESQSLHRHLASAGEFLADSVP